jgi:siroheme synthase-like protein
MKKSNNAVFFPVLINLQKFPCLLVGGGEVALRKVEVLLEFNAIITILSPMICEPLKKLIKKYNITVIKKYYSKEYLKNFKLVFSATNIPEVNKAVFNDCKKEGIILNVVDTPDLCDFILPAIVKRNDLTISVSSQGKAPFLVKDIKKRLEHIYPDIYADILELAGMFRVSVLDNKKIKTQKSKAAAFNKFLMVDWKRLIRTEGINNAKKVMKALLKEVEG